MRAATIAFEKLYWLAMATVPLFPSYVLHTYNSLPACSNNGICFHFGYILNREGTAIILLAAFLLWPICAWQLAGKHIWSRIHRHRSSPDSPRS